MSEFVKKTAFGYKPVSGGRSDPECTHVILTEREYAKMLQQISNAEQEVRNTKYDADKEIRRVQIDAQRKIESIAYETAKKINDDMTLLFGAFLNCYNVSSLNYQTLENIITNGKFSMTELSIDDNLSTQNLEKVISFIENNVLCKGKKALHEALVLKRTSKPTNISNSNQMLLWKEDKLILSGNYFTPLRQAFPLSALRTKNQKRLPCYRFSFLRKPRKRA